jgi:undecaprenyl-diphosphatase
MSDRTDSAEGTDPLEVMPGPESVSGRARLFRRPAAALMASAAVAFALLAVLVSQIGGPVPAFDRWASGGALSFAQAHPAWLWAMRRVTTTGGLGVLGPVVALLGLGLILGGHRREGALAWTAMIVTVTVRNVLVGLIARPRPEHQLSAVTNFSFPSGHSTASASVAVLLILTVRPLLRRRWSRIVLTAAATAWALAVGLSRVALVVHWPTDVLGAWLFVAVTMSAAVLLFGLGKEGRAQR